MPTEEGWSKGKVPVEGGDPVDGWVCESDGTGVIFWPDGGPFGYAKSSGWIKLRGGKILDTFFVAGQKANPNDPPLWGMQSIQDWVKDEVREVAYKLHAEGEKPYDDYIVNPMRVYTTMQRSSSAALAHIRRYSKGIDPYQMIKTWMPRRQEEE